MSLSGKAGRLFTMNALTSFLTGTTLVVVIALVAMLVLVCSILWWNRKID
jgi:hypothetical protein